jgi:hypothetical protein
MKIKTLDELLNKIDSDLHWRKREIFEIKSLLEFDKLNIEYQKRVLIPLLYSHWEGFIKNISNFYLNYLSQKNILKSELKLGLISLFFNSEIEKLIGQKKINKSLFLLQKISNLSEIKFEKNLINSNSNLNYEVFENILQVLEIDSSLITEDEKNLINKLVNLRNHIAHGFIITISEEDYNSIKIKIIPLLERYKTVIIESAVNETYLLRNNGVKF